MSTNITKLIFKHIGIQPYTKLYHELNIFFNKYQINTNGSYIHESIDKEQQYLKEQQYPK
jgi:hypothetical protein